MSQQDVHADRDAPEGALAGLAAALDGADELDADARLELLRRIEAGIAAELDGLDGL
ncbi:MAG: hypothetical protein ACO4BW_06975 [Nitriliruptoraceae bacterium]